MRYLERAVVNLFFDMQAILAYTVGMKSSHKQLQYTIRSVPPSLDRAIRLASRRRRKSLNETLLETLTVGVGLKETQLFDDLDFFWGSWIEDPAVELALQDQRKIDAGLWK